MKIAILSRLQGRGGLEKYTRYLAQAFVDRGCDVRVLTTSSAAKFPCETIPLVNKSRLNICNIIDFNRRCRNWLRSHPCDIVFGTERTTKQTHYRAGNGVHAAYLKSRGEEGLLKRLSFSINPLHRLILSYERQAFESPSLQRLFVNSHMVKKQIVEHYSTPLERIEVIHNGVEWKDWQSPFAMWPKVRPKLFEKLQLNPNYLQLLFVGHGFRRKGLYYLLQGLARVERSFQLSIVGKDRDAHYFMQLAKRLNLNVKFFGERCDILSFYQVCDLLVIPSTYDPFANVTVEALAMGLFVVSSKENGAHEILTEQTGAIFQDLKDAESVAKTLQKALSHPKTVESALAIRAQTRHLDFSYQLKQVVESTLKK